jgi:Squalene/phytoene synthase
MNTLTWLRSFTGWPDLGQSTAHESCGSYLPAPDLRHTSVRPDKDVRAGSLPGQRACRSRGGWLWRRPARGRVRDLNDHILKDIGLSLVDWLFGVEALRATAAQPTFADDARVRQRGSILAAVEARRPTSPPLAAGKPGVEPGEAAQRIDDPEEPLAWTFRFLPVQRRRAMRALYAFRREIVRIVDGEASSFLKQSLLSGWRSEIALLYAGTPRHAVSRSLLEPAPTYGLKCDDFLAVINGLEMEAGPAIRRPASRSSICTAPASPPP